MAEINLGNDTTINTTIANSNEITAEVPDINYIPGYKEAEEERRANEIIRQENEQDRIALYEDMENKLATGYFDGDDGVGLNYNWNNTSLGIKREDESEYSYTDLKGAKGDDGVSPSASVTQGTGSATITITDGSGTTTAVLYDGEKGDKGEKGDPGAIKTQVVQELPSVGDENTIYLVPITPDVSGNNYAEYLYINGQWELLGKIGIATDLTDYYTKSQTDTLLNAKANMSDLSTVATSGSYNDLSNKPTNVSTFTNDANYVTSNGNATQSDEDTSLTFTNTLSAPMEIDLKGNTKQDSLSGKNKLPFTNQDFTLNNVRYYAQNGNLFLNGTSTGETGSTNANFKNNFSFYLPAGTYILNSKKLDANQPMYIRNYATNDSLAMINGNTIRTATFTLTETTQCYLSFYVYQKVFSNMNLEMQLEQSSSPTSYEQYCGGIPSPSPDYPQDVNVVSGNNTITISDDNEHSTSYPINLPVKNIMNIPDGTGTRGNNTFTALNQEITINSNTSGTESAFYVNDVSQTSQYAAASYSSARDYNMTSTGGTYTLTTYFSYKPEYNFQVYLFTNKRVARKTTNDNWDNGKLVNTITLDSDEYIKSVQCYMPAALVLNNLKITAQLEEGSNTNAYHPYGTTPIELCKIGTYQDYFYKDSGKWYLHKETFNITLDGTESSWATAAAGWYSQSFTSIIKKSSPALSKQYTYTSSTWQGNYTFSINSSGFIAISDNRYTVRTDWINYLSNNNVDMLCVLDTPTNTEITDTTLIEQLEAIASATSYEGETNINQVNNDLPFIITAEVFNDNYNGRYQSVLEMYKRLKDAE